jgi:endonuclease/exonuclease/phosphatase family metal-dependent hydrolase
MRKGWLVLSLGLCLPALSGADPSALTSYSAPKFISFKDLLRLAETATPEGDLDIQLRRVLHTPFVSNEAWYRGARPRRPAGDGIGPVLRAVQWNISGGARLDLIKLAFTSPAAFEAESAKNGELSSDALLHIRKQIELLQNADVVILNEVDLGMGRTEYGDIARELAQALDMNYAYGVEFVEVDKLELGLAHTELEDPDLQAELVKQLEVNPDRYRGLHGSAILSRYPIRNAHVHRLVTCYDWYGKEKQAIAELEKGKRMAASRVFLARIARELRHGNRIALIADIEVPESPTGLVTVASAHLENKCPPECRRAQMADLLLVLKDVANPVIIGGDLNTTGHDAAPTSIRLEISKRLKNPDFWIRQILFRFASPTAIPEALLLPTNYFKNFYDPTARDVPLFASNREAGLFRALERFRFRDGYAFDFRGGKTLANSNERALKGFKPTFEFERDYGGLMGAFKLDWFLIKPFVRSPRERKGSTYFAPVRAHTLSEMNRAIPDRRISDHAPIVVDLRLEPDK